MTQTREPSADSALPRKTLSIKVLGVGGAGCNAVNHLARRSLSCVEFVVMNTDATALAQSGVARKLMLGSKSTRGLGAGGDPECGRAAAEEDLDQIRALCQGADVVFVIAGLGGGTGTGGAPVVARAAKESGALVLGIVMLPFDCEGSRRQRQANLGLHELKSVADGVICLPNQKVFRLIDEKTSLVEAFQITNDLVDQGVRGIWRLLTRPGLINVDFADLCSVTRERHAESTLATAEAKGEQRSREVIEKLFNHPLMDGGQALTEATAILVCIAGSSELGMSEVNRIMEQINRHAEQAHIIMGAAVDDSFKDRLSVTLIASRRNGSGAGSASRPETAEIGAAAPSGFERHLMDPDSPSRPAFRFAAPAPALTPERAEQLMSQQGGGLRGRKNGGSRMRQGQLPLEIISKGRFEKSEPTVHQGQDLDVPTYIRRGLVLN